MSTKPLGPPPILADDPGPWSVVSSVFGIAVRPDRRRPQAPMGLMLSPAPQTVLDLAGLEDDSPVAGVGRVTVVAGAREPAFALTFGDDGLSGVSPYVRRVWSVPGLSLQVEDRPPEDPSTGLPDPIHPAELREPGHAPIATSPGGEVAALHTREGRNDVVAVVRVADGALVRWVRGARAAAWSPDGAHLALGGPWGVLLSRARGAAS